MIYLFSNLNYGSRFIETARTYSLETKTPISLVFSSKKKISKDPIIGIPMKLLHNIRAIIDSTILTRRLHFNVICTTNINSPWFYSMINNNDHGIIAGFNQIFKEKIINRFKSLVNFHPSILPLYKGPVPSFWCIKNGESRTGYTLHKVTEKIDDGEILFQEEISIGDISDPGILDQKLADLAAVQFYNYLRFLNGGKPWIIIRSDASQVYRVQLAYGSFPGFGSSKQ